MINLSNEEIERMGLAKALNRVADELVKVINPVIRAVNDLEKRRKINDQIIDSLNKRLAKLEGTKI